MSRRVLIVDDHPSFRAAARLLLEYEGFEVIGEAEDGAGGISATAALRPDVVLLDVNLPDVDGFDVASRICLDDTAPKVVPPPQPRSARVRAAGAPQRRLRVHPEGRADGRSTFRSPLR